MSGTLTTRGARRARLAIVSPWPPEQSGIADYSLRLSRELARGVDVDVVVCGPVAEYEQPVGDGVRLLSSRSDAVAARLSEADRVLYCMGNSRFHGHVYKLLSEHTGAVVLHDVQLAGFYSWLASRERPDDPLGRLTERVDEQYGTRIPLSERGDEPLSWERRAELGIYMTAEIQRHAQQLFVHSRFARGLVVRDGFDLDRRVPVCVMPFGMPPPSGDGCRPTTSQSPLVVHMGVLNEIKGIGVLIQAFGLLCAEFPAARLVIAGPVEPPSRRYWQEFAHQHAPHATIEIPGHLSRERYDDLLKTADLAVQLRAVSTGEASGAICDCLAAGVPTIVTDLGWTSELPHTAVAHTPPGVSPELLAARMNELIIDAGRRTALSEAGRAYTRTRSFERVAAEYLDALGLA